MMIGGFHGEGSIGLSIDGSDLLNSKVYLYSQQSVMVGLGAEACGGISVGGSMEKTQQIQTGLSVQGVVHLEGNVGVKGVAGVSVDLPIDANKKSPTGLGLSTGVTYKGRGQGGVAAFVGGGVGVSETYAFPSFRDIWNWLK